MYRNNNRIASPDVHEVIDMKKVGLGKEAFMIEEGKWQERMDRLCLLIREWKKNSFGSVNMSIFS